MSKLEEFEIFWKSLAGRKVNKEKAKEVYLKIKTNLSPQELSKRFNILYRKTGEENMFLILKDGLEMKDGTMKLMSMMMEIRFIEIMKVL